MGGSNTQTMPSPPPTAPAASASAPQSNTQPPTATPQGITKPTPTTDKIEFHVNEAEGKQHIHNRTQNLKIAIPISDYYARMMRFQTDPTEEVVRFVDSQNMTQATIWADMQPQPDGSLKLFGFSRVDKIALDASYTSLVATILNTAVTS